MDYGHTNKFFIHAKKTLPTQPAGVENPGIIMDHFKTQYISLQALPNQLKFTDLRSIFATSWRNKTKISERLREFGTFWLRVVYVLFKTSQNSVQNCSLGDEFKLIG